MIKRLLLPALCLSLLLTGAALAQPPGGTCPTTVNDALQRLNAVCGGLSRNEACYASNSVTATFYEDVDETVFSQPSDIVPLNTLQRITTSPLSETGDRWGVAIMNVQANIPNTLPGQGVMMVMMGDTTLENAVSPDEAVVLSDPIEGTIASGGAVNVRSGAGTNFNVLGTLNAGAAVGVDARNEAGDWLRLVFEDQPAWIAAFLVDLQAEVSALPVIGSTSFSPMQAFVIQTGIGRPECQTAPNSLLVQSPQSVEITLNVNGLDVSIASTVLFSVPENNKLSIGVIDGRATLPDETVVPAGFTAQAPLNDDGFFDDEPIIAENNDETEDRFIVEPFELEDLEEFDAFEEIEDEFFNYDLEIADELADFEIFEDVDIDEFLEEFDGDFDFEDFERFGFSDDNDYFDDFDDDSYGYGYDGDDYGYDGYSGDYAYDDDDYSYDDNYAYDDYDYSDGYNYDDSYDDSDDEDYDSNYSDDDSYDDGDYDYSYDDYDDGDNYDYSYDDYDDGDNYDDSYDDGDYDYSYDDYDDSYDYNDDDYKYDDNNDDGGDDYKDDGTGDDDYSYD